MNVWDIKGLWDEYNRHYMSTLSPMETFLIHWNSGVGIRTSRTTYLGGRGIIVRNRQEALLPSASGRSHHGLRSRQDLMYIALVSQDIPHLLFSIGVDVALRL